MSIDLKSFIDIQEIIAESKIFLKDLYDSNKPIVQETAESYLADSEKRLTLLAQNRLRSDNPISDDFMLERLQDEKDIFISELTSFAVIGKAIAQEAANKYVDFLTEKVTEALEKLNLKNFS